MVTIENNRKWKEEGKNKRADGTTTLSVLSLSVNGISNVSARKSLGVEGSQANFLRRHVPRIRFVFRLSFRQFDVLHLRANTVDIRVPSDSAYYSERKLFINTFVLLSCRDNIPKSFCVKHLLLLAPFVSYSSMNANLVCFNVTATDLQQATSKIVLQSWMLLTHSPVKYIEMTLYNSI